VSAPRSLRLQLVSLTAAKLAANTALRWVVPFLPTLERAFGSTTATLTTVIGVAELGGLSTSLTGRHLDTGHQRRIVLAGTAAVAASAVIALAGTVPWFAVSMVILIIGVANLTVAGHAWISARVPYERRGRAIGAFETSWAIALLVGAPTIALLIRWWGWRAPFVALAVAATLGWLLVWRTVERDVLVPADPDSDGGARAPLPWRAWCTLTASALTAAGGLSVFVVSGVWLDDRHDVSTGGLGLVAMGFGALELAASSAAALVSDRVGKTRSVVIGLAVLVLGLAVTAMSGDSLLLAVVGLTTVLTGFEYAFVTSLSLVSEAAPTARGRAIATGNALGTLARAGAVSLSGLLYEAVGIGGSLGFSLIVVLTALVLYRVAVRGLDLR
jgi:predicted MFS family arabinose efflux permease